MANWASIAEVLAYTGTTVTDAQISQAQGVMDVMANVTTEATSNLKARDRRLLKQATAYQTVWMVNQVDTFTRTDVTDVRQDGVEFTVTHDDSLILAPLAKRCLDRLSWRKSRSIRTERGETRYSTVEALQSAWLRDGPGADSGWVPG